MHCCHLSVQSANIKQSLRARLTFVLLAPNFAQQHTTQLLPPVYMLGLVSLDQAVEIALSLGVWGSVELLFRGAIPHHRTFLVDDVVTVRLGGEDGVEGRQRLRHGVRQLRKHCTSRVLEAQCACRM